MAEEVSAVYQLSKRESQTGNPSPVLLYCSPFSQPLKISSLAPLPTVGLQPESGRRSLPVVSIVYTRLIVFSIFRCYLGSMPVILGLFPGNLGLSCSPPVSVLFAVAVCSLFVEWQWRLLMEIVRFLFQMWISILSSSVPPSSHELMMSCNFSSKLPRRRQHNHWSFGDPATLPVVEDKPKPGSCSTLSSNQRSREGPSPWRSASRCGTALACFYLLSTAPFRALCFSSCDPSQCAGVSSPFFDAWPKGPACNVSFRGIFCELWD